MKRIRQQIMSGKDSRPRGDCFKACLASVLERPLDEVPHFVDLESELGMYHLDLANAWLGKQEYPFKLLHRRMIDVGDKPLTFYIRRKKSPWAGHGYEIPGYWLMSVRSKNFAGSHHVVVARDDAVVWDPSPRFGEDAYDRKPYLFEGWAYIFQVEQPQNVRRGSWTWSKPQTV